MIQSRSRTYVNAQVTDKEVILNAKTLLGLSSFEQRIRIDKIDSVSLGKEMGAGNKVFLIVGMAFFAAAIAMFASMMIAVAVPMLIVGLVIILLACLLRPVSLSIGCGCRIENVFFKHFNGSKSKDVYTQLLAVLAANGRPQPPVVGVRRPVDPAQGNTAH